MTIRDAYAASVRQLTDASHDEAHSAARLLVDAIAGVRYAHLVQPETALDAAQQARWRALLDEAGDGRPLPYILGHREFCGLEFSCDEQALIPRPETEILVEAAVARLRGRPVRIADLGTGTGCIAVSVAHLLPDAAIWASDAAPGALALARANATRHGVAARISFAPSAPGDWAGPLRDAGVFDAVLTNPPYIAAAEIEGLQPTIRDWEPRAALDGGADGLDAYRQLATQCGALLAPGGFLMMEIGAGQSSAARKIFRAAGWTVEALLLDLAGIERVLTARRV